MSEENDKLAKLYEDTAKKILDAMNEKDTRIKALEQQLAFYKGQRDITEEPHYVEAKKRILELEQQLREKESCCNCEYHLTKQANEKIAELTTKLSEAEVRVKELEHFISVSVDCHLLEKFNQVVADKEKLESRLAQELERGKLKDAVVNVAKRFLIGHATLDALKDSLTAIDKPSGDK